MLMKRRKGKYYKYTLSLSLTHTSPCLSQMLQKHSSKQLWITIIVNRVGKGKRKICCETHFYFFVTFSRFYSMFNFTLHSIHLFFFKLNIFKHLFANSSLLTLFCPMGAGRLGIVRCNCIWIDLDKYIFIYTIHEGAGFRTEPFSVYVWRRSWSGRLCFCRIRRKIEIYR